MGLFLGWPIHRARGAPEEAPVLGQRQAGLPASRGKVQMRPSAAPGALGVHSPPRATSPRGRRAVSAAGTAAPPGPRTPRPDLEPTEQGAPAAAPPRARNSPPVPRVSPHAARPADPCPLPSFFSASPAHLPLCRSGSSPLAYLPRLSLLPPRSLFTFLSFPPSASLSVPAVPSTLLCPSAAAAAAAAAALPGLRTALWPRASVSPCSHHPRHPCPRLGTWRPGPGGRKDGSRGKGPLFLAGTRAALVPPGLPRSSS